MELPNSARDPCPQVRLPAKNFFGDDPMEKHVTNFDELVVVEAVFHRHHDTDGWIGYFRCGNPALLVPQPPP